MILFSLWASTPDSKDYYRRKAEALLKEHASDREVLELVLASTAQLPSPERQQPYRPGRWAYALLGYLVALNAAPRTVIGVGKGRRRLAFWTWWGRLVLYTLPIFVLGKLLLPQILAWFGVR
jgi:hypothetical protein